MSFTLIILLFFFLFIVGVSCLIYRKQYNLLIFGVGIPTLLVVAVITAFFFFMSYQPKPNNLDVTVAKEGNHYVAKGKWNKPLEYYRFSTDYVVFTLPKGQEVTNFKRERYKDIHSMDDKLLKQEVLDWIKKPLNKNEHSQVEDIEAHKNFTFSFDLPEGVSLKDVSITYVHAHSEPMDSNTYWAKTIEN